MSKVLMLKIVVVASTPEELEGGSKYVLQSVEDAAAEAAAFVRAMILEKMESDLSCTVLKASKEEEIVVAVPLK